uniref:laccase n=1 Tax=Setaria viridis TaxID=4556 RepID=A0A4U6TI53_SETVI|nr:LOW QUALITY PROTEIN: hypothetical protein SEVIR_8G219900v2 [Setaria viridis]
MKTRSMSLPVAATAVAFAVIFALSAMAIGGAAAAVVEHTFVVSEMTVRHLCKETLVTVVNGQLPGPVIEVTEGDTVVVHVVNKSPHNITIHCTNCWADGVPMITQCPILPNQNYTYRFDVAEQEGTLWWHSYTSCLRATMHGAIIIRPRHGVSSYPFPKPHKEIPIIVGEWWEMDLDELDRSLVNGYFFDIPKASTINSKLGDLQNCSGVKEDSYVLDVEPGKTAALFSEYYLKIAGHKFTVVGADANYVRPYTTDIIAIAPGETVDALMVADAPPGRYYITAVGNQAPKPDPQLPLYIVRGTVQYSTCHIADDGTQEDPCVGAPVAPEMPDQHDVMLSLYFHGNLTSLNHTRQTQVPQRADESLYITIGLGSICRRGGQSCKRSGNFESIMVATMNNVSFKLPDVNRPVLEAHYYNTSDMDALQELPDRPPKVFNFTDVDLIPWGPKERRVEPTSKAALARRFRYGAVVDIVFQSMSVIKSDSNPMHLHGHDMFLLAQGVGNFDPARDVAKYNLVDPPLRNSVLVPRVGWAAVRFVADNPDSLD